MLRRFNLGCIFIGRLISNNLFSFPFWGYWLSSSKPLHLSLLRAQAKVSCLISFLLPFQGLSACSKGTVGPFPPSAPIPCLVFPWWAAFPFTSRWEGRRLGAYTFPTTHQQRLESEGGQGGRGWGWGWVACWGGWPRALDRELGRGRSCCRCRQRSRCGCRWH